LSQTWINKIDSEVDVSCLIKDYKKNLKKHKNKKDEVTPTKRKKAKRKSLKKQNTINGKKAKKTKEKRNQEKKTKEKPEQEKKTNIKVVESSRKSSRSRKSISPTKFVCQLDHEDYKSYKVESDKYWFGEKKRLHGAVCFICKIEFDNKKRIISLYLLLLILVIFALILQKHVKNVYVMIVALN